LVWLVYTTSLQNNILQWTPLIVCVVNLMILIFL
jgi:hypothetical protein